MFSVRLIVAVPFDTISDVHLHRLLDNVFQSLVLLIGLEDLVAQRNTERIKKDLRVSTWLMNHQNYNTHFKIPGLLIFILYQLCSYSQAVYPLIDTLLECAVQPSNNHVNFGDVVGCTDCIAFPEANLLQVDKIDHIYFKSYV